MLYLIYGIPPNRTFEIIHRNNVTGLPSRRRKIFSTENMAPIRYNNEIMHSTENTVFGLETPSTEKTALHSKCGIVMKNTH